jgi:hypothetical protein
MGRSGTGSEKLASPPVTKIKRIVFLVPVKRKKVYVFSNMLRI